MLLCFCVNRSFKEKTITLWNISLSFCGKESQSCASPSTREEDFSHMRVVSVHVWHFCLTPCTHAVQDAVDFVACKPEEKTSCSLQLLIINVPFAQYFSKVTVLELCPNAMNHFFPSCVWIETC